MSEASFSGSNTRRLLPHEAAQAGHRRATPRSTELGLLADTTQVAFPQRFQVLRRLGLGGMAEVFSAIEHDPAGLQRSVVIKRPLPDLAAHPEFLAMFLDEARIASSLQHPNIVRVLDVIHQPDTCLIVMELVEGKSLSALLARLERSGQRLESRLAAFVVARAAEGLHYAHSRTDAEGKPLQIVHRDVSPQNVLVSFTGDVKVIDFGIAHALGRVTQTRTGTRKGKTGYMAPEQARAGAIDRRVDVFALGILLWELTCGRRLFVRPDDFRTMNALLVDPIPLPSSVAAVPADLEAIIMRALSRNPVERYQSAEEMRHELDAFTASLGGAIPAELGALVKVLFANDAPTLRQDSANEIQPAVVTGTTSPLPRRGYDRRHVALLAVGSLIACGMGAAVGWVGNQLGMKPNAIVSASSGMKVAGAVPRVPGPLGPPIAFGPTVELLPAMDPLPTTAPGQAAPATTAAAPVIAAPVRPARIASRHVELAEASAPPELEPQESSATAARTPRPTSAGARRLRNLNAKSNPF